MSSLAKKRFVLKIMSSLSKSIFLNFSNPAPLLLAKTETLSAKTEKFSAKTEIFL
jgi:hypothetical protein